MEPLKNLEPLFHNQLTAHRLDAIQAHPWADPYKQDPLWAHAQHGDFGILPDGFFSILFYIRNAFKWLFEHTENTGVTCSQKTWDSSRPAEGGKPQLKGGGTMTVMRGQNMEKAAVNMSIVRGPQYPAIEGEYAGKPFVAAGVSLIAHPRNPHAPTMHLNVRCLSVEKSPQDKVIWMGGGGDLTPMLPQEEDVILFHNGMRLACENTPSVGDYPRFSQWAKEYFYIPHRNKERGVGGIFFDYIPVQGTAELQLLLDVGQYAGQAYGTILQRRMQTPYGQDLEDQFLVWRGHYAEFNLAYDRGTRFGLASGGNTEAILCSLPPRVRW